MASAIVALNLSSTGKVLDKRAIFEVFNFKSIFFKFVT
jgi:hypothetical protein